MSRHHLSLIPKLCPSPEGIYGVEHTVRNVGAAESILLPCQCGLYKSTSSFNDNLLGNDRLCKLPLLHVDAGNSKAALLKGFKNVKILRDSPGVAVSTFT